MCGSCALRRQRWGQTTERKHGYGNERLRRVKSEGPAGDQADLRAHLLDPSVRELPNQRRLDAGTLLGDRLRDPYERLQA